MFFNVQWFSRTLQYRRGFVASWSFSQPVSLNMKRVFIVNMELMGDPLSSPHLPPASVSKPRTLTHSTRRPSTPLSTTLPAFTVTRFSTLPHSDCTPNPFLSLRYYYSHCLVETVLAYYFDVAYYSDVLVSTEESAVC